MSAAPGIARVVPPAGPDPVPAPAPRRRTARLGGAWMQRIAWAVDRTGRSGFLGIALLVAAAVFLISTYLPVARQAEALRASVAGAQRQARAAAPAPAAEPNADVRALPASTELPALLRQLFRKATDARLAVDTGRYEINTTKSSGIVRYLVTFPVTGPYPQIREFLDTALTTMPQVSLSGLALERKSIADGEVEAQIRMTFYTVAAGAGAHAPGTRPAGDRVVSPRHAGALFAQHSWTVLKPVVVPPPQPPPPPPDPTAPPLPYALVGSVAPAGEQPAYYLAKGDRMITAHVGDKLDGVYLLQSAAGGQLVFVYLPLNIRQNIPLGGSP